MATIKEAIEYSKSNPDSPFATELRRRIESGQMNKELQAEGLTQYMTQPETPALGTKLIERGSNIVDSLSLKGARESLSSGQGGIDTALASAEALVKAGKTPFDIARQLGGGVGDIFSAGLQASGLDKPLGEAVNTTLATVRKGYDAYNTLPEPTKQALSVLTFGVRPPTPQQLQTAKEAYQGLSPEMKDTLSGILDISNLIGLDVGVVGAGKLASKTGSALSGATTGVRNRAVGLLDRAKEAVAGVDKNMLDTTLSTPEVSSYINSADRFGNVREAVKQGYNQEDIKFLSSLSEQDKGALQEMKKLADAGADNLRNKYAGKRPIDVVGDTILDPLRNVQKLNTNAGYMVDAEARKLVGQAVDATPVLSRAEELLGNAGVTFTENGLDFTNSIFKKIPALQKKITQAFSDLPKGQIDGYDLHNFKKSLDEVLDFEKRSAGGLTGQATNILKLVRGEADNLLDKTFPSYNTANTTFKETRDILDSASSLFGGKTDFFSARANQRVSQASRALFNNTTKRNEMYDFLENLTNTAGKYGISVNGNPVDQAIFAQVLEGIYGTPAITGLQGEVKKALTTAKEFADRPIARTIEAGINKMEELQNITPEAKRKVLDSFIQRSTKTFAEIKGSLIPKRSPALEELQSRFSKYDEFTNPERTPLRTARYTILTAENPNALKLSDKENALRNKELVKQLKESGYNPIPVTGHYGGNPENSFIVAGMSPTKALEYAKKYGQESVLTKEGLIYRDGTVNPADTSNINFASNQEDFFSEATIDGKKVKFSIPIDFEKKVPLDSLVNMPQGTEVQKIVEGVAPKAKEYIDDLAKKISRKDGGIVAEAPLKSYDSLMRKLKTEKNGNLSDVTDIARNTIVYTKAGTKEKFLDRIKNTDGFVSMKEQTPELFAGYNGFLTKVKAPNGHIAEIQVMSPEMFYKKMEPAVSKKVLGMKLWNEIAKKTGKEAGLGHKFYEEMRILDEFDPVDYAKVIQLRNKSVEYYKD